MTEYTAYWTATIVRGIVALLASATILILSEVGATILLYPFALLLSILSLAAYIVIDSAVVLATSFMLPHHRLGGIALRVQGLCGIAIGAFLFFLASEKVQLPWFLYLAAAQALSVAVAEFVVARRTAAFHESTWCYASACIPALSAVVLLIFHAADQRQLAWLVYSYLGLFGLNLFVLAARMLFKEAHAARLAQS